MKKKCLIIVATFSLFLMANNAFGQDWQNEILKRQAVPMPHNNFQTLIKKDTVPFNRDLLFRESDKQGLKTRDLLYRPDVDGKLSTIRLNNENQLNEIISIVNEHTISRGN